MRVGKQYAMRTRGSANGRRGSVLALPVSRFFNGVLGEHRDLFGSGFIIIESEG